MAIDTKQRQTLAKSFVSFATYALTTVPFGFFMDSKDISVWMYVVITIIGIVFLSIGIYFSKEDKKKEDNIINADIKKGIFHINNATINNDKTTI